MHQGKPIGYTWSTMKDLVIIKLGGSVISQKLTGRPVARKQNIARLAQEIKSVWQTKKFPLIVIHGAGSFGHPRAKKYRLWDGLTTWRQTIEFTRNHLDDIAINTIVLTIFLKTGLPVFPVQPSSCLLNKNKLVDYFDTTVIETLLKKGFIPVLYGNVVIDKILTGSICSGDTMLTLLAKKFAAQKIIFATDVDGVFDRDPHKFSNARLIKKIDDQIWQKYAAGIGGSSAKVDIGGGMRGKIADIKTGLYKTPVRILNGLKKNQLYRALTGQATGTSIIFSKAKVSRT